jgi:hypothetical protein
MVLEIKGIERPSGEIYSFEECRRRNRYLEKTFDEMRAIAEDLALREGLTGQIYILNTTGRSRDDYGIGFEYPASRAMEERLNKTFSATRIKDWAKDLPPEQREEYLRNARSNGYEGYL